MYYLGPLFLRGQIHMICQPVKSFHSVRQFNAGAVFPLLDLGD